MSKPLYKDHSSSLLGGKPRGSTLLTTRPERSRRVAAILAAKEDTLIANNNHICLLTGGKSYEIIQIFGCH